MALPAIVEHDGIFVVRDDVHLGGTKARVLPRFLTGADEFVYASPVYGYAQIALSHCCKAAGKKATIFCAKRGELHARTQEAKRAGAKIVQVPHGYLSNVQSKARAYAEATGSQLIPFGLDFPEFLEALATVAISLDIKPSEVWTVAGSGVLTRALQMAWPAARFYAVRIGAAPDAGCATVLTAPEKFEQDAKMRPPFPSCTNYDAKAWQFIRHRASPGSLFWNVAA
jgi:hypothetical protein